MAAPPFTVSTEPVPLTHILTAGEAQVDYLLSGIVPAFAKVLVVSGGEQAWRRDLKTRGGKYGLGSTSIVLACKGGHLSRIVP